jgi:hypothetical protein
MFPHVFYSSGVGVLRRRLQRSSSYSIYCFAWRCLLLKYCRAAVWGSLFIIELLVGFIYLAWGSSTSTSCSQDWRSPSSGCVYRSCDWDNYQIHWIRRCIVKNRATVYIRVCLEGSTSLHSTPLKVLWSSKMCLGQKIALDPDLWSSNSFFFISCFSFAYESGFVLFLQCIGAALTCA